jgi:xanthine dehydrogenase YagS FAD-binding subunit
MLSFDYRPASSRADAIRLANPRLAGAPTSAAIQFLAGGTTLIDLMKLEVMRPAKVVDINALGEHLDEISVDENELRLGALARMSDAADHPGVRRDYPVIAQSLQLAASAQLRNMASLGGNVLQRTRCPYFRDVSWACNKRDPGSGCSAIEGITRSLAVLGTSDHCIANYPGDFAIALAALDAEVDTEGPGYRRTIAFADLHRLPGDTPHIETTLSSGEMIVGFRVRAAPWTRRSLYLKVRDRTSYEFALASTAVALDLDGDNVREARIALGGVAAKPWRSHVAEAALQGKALTEETARIAAEAAFADAHGDRDRSFKPELGRRTLARALMQCRSMEI